MCTGDGIVKKKGGNVDSRCGETRWLKVEKERREREKKKEGEKRKNAAILEHARRCLHTFVHNERGWMEERFLNVTPFCVLFAIRMVMWCG